MCRLGIFTSSVFSHAQSKCLVIYQRISPLQLNYVCTGLTLMARTNETWRVLFSRKSVLVTGVNAPLEQHDPFSVDWLPFTNRGRYPRQDKEVPRVTRTTPCGIGIAVSSAGQLVMANTSSGFPTAHARMESLSFPANRGNGRDRSNR